MSCPTHHRPVVWITGLAAAGKTTIARRVVATLRARGLATVHVDGDAMREVLGNDLGHHPADRLENAWRIARMCRYLQSEGVAVVCSTMSLYPSIWHANRASLDPYVEVYLRVPLEVVRARDPKGLYARAERGEAKNIVGLDLPFHEPDGAHLVLDNADAADLAPNCERIVDVFLHAAVEVTR